MSSFSCFCFRCNERNLSWRKKKRIIISSVWYRFVTPTNMKEGHLPENMSNGCKLLDIFDINFRHMDTLTTTLIWRLFFISFFRLFLCFPITNAYYNHLSNHCVLYSPFLLVLWSKHPAVLVSEWRLNSKVYWNV